MSFTPARNLIIHQSGGETEIGAWLRSLLPADGWQDGITLIPLDHAPEDPPVSSSTETFPGGPLLPTGVCPRTGRRLQLYMRRDLSCAILREGPAEGPAYEVFPAALAIASEIHCSGYKDICYLQRQDLPRLRVHVRRDGLRWLAINCDVAVEELGALFARDLARVADSILDGDAIYDPRHHDNPPEGGRFAPFSHWPMAKDRPDLIDPLTEALNAIATVHNAQTKTGPYYIRIGRRFPGTPWQPKSDTHSVVTNPYSKGLIKQLRRALRDSRLAPPACLGSGAKDAKLIQMNDAGQVASMHAKIAAYAVLSNLFQARLPDILHPEE